MEDVGELHHFLGIKVIKNSITGDIGQSAYTEHIVQRFGMENAKAVLTPVDTSSPLVQVMETSEDTDQFLYQSAVGSLLYLSTRTRPDITYVCSEHCSKILCSPFSSALGCCQAYPVILEGCSAVWLALHKEIIK